MTSDVHRLVYYSRNRMALAQPTFGEAIATILSASQANNKAVHVTGALIFNSGVFAQVLEGDMSAVEQTFERIQRDPRHGEVQVLAFEKVLSRLFPSWSMGYVGASREGQDVFGKIGPQTGFDASRLEGDRILRIMQEIAMDEEKRIA